MSSYTRQQMEAWLKTIEVKGGKILDVGGSQNTLDGRLKVFEPEEYKILDLEVPHECKQKPDIIFDINSYFIRDDEYSTNDFSNGFIYEVCRPLVEAGMYDLYNKTSKDFIEDLEEADKNGFVLGYDKAIDDIKNNPDNYNEKVYKLTKFDTVFCLEVSEYWYNPLLALRNINFLLKKGGILYISFHFVYPVHNPADQDYLRYTPFGAIKLLKEAGFEIVDIQPRLITKDITRIDGMRPAKGYDRHDWSGCLIKAKKL